MGKIAINIAFIWLVSYPVFGQFTGSYRNIRNNVIDTICSYYFVQESTGANDGYYVEKFIASTGLNPKGGYAWCAAFITYTFKSNNLQVPKYPARAAAWFDKEHIIKNENAIPGDLGSLYYRNLGRIGHIVMYLNKFNNATPYIKTAEGNTNRQGSREGNSVAMNKIRPKAIIYNSADWITPQIQKPCK